MEFGCSLAAYSHPHILLAKRTTWQLWREIHLTQAPHCYNDEAQNSGFVLLVAQAHRIGIVLALEPPQCKSQSGGKTPDFICP